MPELGLMGAQTALDVAQALAIRQLSEGHAEVLIHAGEGFDVPLATVPLHTASEFLVGNKLRHLGKDCSSIVHGPPPKAEYSPCRNSNRFRARKANCFLTLYGY